MSASRRSFLGGAAASLIGVLAVPTRLFGRSTRALLANPPLRVPHGGPLDEPFWRELRRQFLIPPDEAFFNTGTLGSQPRVVLDAVTAHMTHIVRDIAHWDYKADTETFFAGYVPETNLRRKLAALIGAGVDEVGLTQNATVAMNFIANGLELERGDEVIVMRGAHPGGRCGWELREKRDGIVLRFVDPPDPVRDPEQLVELYEAATTARTRVWAIPHLTSGVGAILFPVDELCRRARARGIVSVIDGAQTVGHLAIDMQRMGCDVFFSSPHKWLLAPVGCGLLYIRRELQPRVWTTLAGNEWDNHEAGMYRLMQYGTGNLSLLVGFERAIDFHDAIGSERIEQRALALTRRLRAGLDGIPGVTIHSPRHPALLTGTTIWSLAGLDGGALQDALWEEARVRVRAVAPGVRQCCHIYTTMDDVERSIAATHAVAVRLPRG